MVPESTPGAPAPAGGWLSQRATRTQPPKPPPSCEDDAPPVVEIEKTEEVVVGEAVGGRTDGGCEDDGAACSVDWGSAQQREGVVGTEGSSGEESSVQQTEGGIDDIISTVWGAGCFCFCEY